MRVNIVSNSEKQANYVCFLAKNISRTLYQNGGFLVLPNSENHKNVVYFPSLSYSINFWNKIKKTKSIDLSDKFPTVCTKEVLRKLKNIKYQNTKINFKEIINKYKNDLKNVSKIEILITPYGTTGSYYVKNRDIFITQRHTSTDKNFEKTLLLSIIKLKNKDRAEVGTINWIKRNSIVKYLLNIKKNSNPKKYIDENKIYLNKLGFPTEKISFSKIIKTLTTQEEKVLKTLRTANTEIVSFDEMADILWGEKVDEKYSLEAISKVIQNLRDKIRLSGIHKNIIHTVRKKGYFLEN